MIDLFLKHSFGLKKEESEFRGSVFEICTTCAFLKHICLYFLSFRMRRENMRSELACGGARHS